MREHDKHSGGIKIRYKTGEQNKYRGLENLTAELLLYVCLMMFFVTFFAMPPILYAVTAFGCVLLGTEHWLGKNASFLEGILLPFSCVLAAAGILFLKTGDNALAEGLKETANYILSRVEQYTYVNIRLFQLQEDSGAGEGNLIAFWIYLTLVFIWIIPVLVRRNLELLLELLLAVVGVLMLGAGIPVSGWLAAMLLACFLALFLNLHCTEEKRGTGRSEKAVVQAMGTAVLGCFLLCVLMLGIGTRLFGESLLTKGGEFVREKIEDIRYGKTEGSNFPEGDFYKIENLKLTDSVALKVVQNKPSSQYLRGFIGSCYTQEGWENLEPAVYYENRDLFYWMEDFGVTPYTQLSCAAKLEGESKGRISMEVYHVNASRKYIYLPYELQSAPAAVSDRMHCNGDGVLGTFGWSGLGTYQFQTAPGLISRYPGISQNYYGEERGGGEEWQRYEKAESHYNQFVYENYLQIPENLEKYLTDTLHIEKGKRYTYEEANHQIYTWLSEHLVYSEEISPLPEKTDFVKFTLGTLKRGYSVHFATAAAMIYRCMGIPSRYVEGYLLTPEIIDGSQPGEIMEITGKQAHAWVEIYQDGIGWIPMEVTPPYAGVMERPGEREASASGTKEVSGGDAKVQQEVQEFNEEPLAVNKNKVQKRRWWLLPAVLLAVILLLVIAYVSYRRHRLSHLEMRLREIEAREAVKQAYLLTVTLLYREKLAETGGSHYRYAKPLGMLWGDDYKIQFQNAVNTMEKAMYSQASITEEDRERLISLWLDTRDNLLNTLSRRKRFYYRYIIFLC